MLMMTTVEQKELRLVLYCLKWCCENAKGCSLSISGETLCNNTEILKLINKYGHSIGYSLIEEYIEQNSKESTTETPTNQLLRPTVKIII